MTSDAKHSLKSMFHRDSSHEHHHGIGKLLHRHDKPESTPASDSEKLSKTPSFLSLRRHNSQTSFRQPEPKKLSKAQTLAHLQSLNSKNHRNHLVHESRKPTPDADDSSISSAAHHDKIVYNPFGINKELADSGPKNAAFYMNSDGHERVLQNPVHDPNTHLPEALHQTHVNLLDDFEIDPQGKKLGSGGSSDVRLVNAIGNKKRVYALKKFTMLPKETDDQFYARATKEFVISKSAISRHVVDCLAIVKIQSQNSLTRGWGFILEFCPGGDLFGLVSRPGWRKAPLSERYCMFKQVAYGLKFLHDHGIVHRDLKPENVLVDANAVCKLCDFGISDYVNEVPGDVTSPVKQFTSFVGSPPYQPPEVMLLKEKSVAEAQKWPYDPFKMDTWGLGMVMFCVAYGGLPFSSAQTADHAYRDYKFNHGRFASQNPVFKSCDKCCKECTKGPGSEFKWAAQFGSTGAARVAWKLCDPSPEHRYNIDHLFEDSWFKSVEMCIYEDPDQEVNPVIYPNPDMVSSTNSSRMASRVSSIQKSYSHHNHESAADSGHFKSMLDVNEALENQSLKSASSLTHADDHIAEECECECDPIAELPKKVRSMLDITGAPKESKPLSALKEGEVAESDDQMKPTSSTSSTSSASSCSCTCHADKARTSRPPSTHQVRSRATSSARMHEMTALPPSRSGSFAFAEFVPSKQTDVHLDSSGICDLGYKIKKHHHWEVSTQQTSGTRR